MKTGTLKEEEEVRRQRGRITEIRVDMGDHTHTHKSKPKFHSLLFLQMWELKAQLSGCRMPICKRHSGIPPYVNKPLKGP